MTRRHILPPQTTALERAVDQTLPAWGWMADSAAPDAARRDPQFLPWLAVDWGVAQFAPYFDSVGALLAATLGVAGPPERRLALRCTWAGDAQHPHGGQRTTRSGERGGRHLSWLMQRGNPYSVRMSLRWVGFAPVTLDEDGAWLHLDLGRVIGGDELRPVAHVVRASIPAHVRFHRVYHGWDLRPIRLDAGRLDDALLDDDSGVWVAVDPYGAPVKVSQGVTRAGLADAPAAHGAQGAHERIHTMFVTYDDRPVLDAWRLDSVMLLDASGGATRLHTAMAPAPERYPGLWLRPGVATSRVCAWDAPAPIAIRCLTHTGAADAPHDDGRSWAGGGWDAQPWRQSFPSHHYTID